jgi:hypothetical protein
VNYRAGAIEILIFGIGQRGSQGRGIRLLGQFIEQVVSKLIDGEALVSRQGIGGGIPD